MIIIILILFIILFTIQECLFKNEKKYKNEYLDFYNKIKIPIFITCTITIIYILCEKNKKSKELDIYLSMPKF
jgi:hypothetical protein